MVELELGLEFAFDDDAGTDVAVAVVVEFAPVAVGGCLSGLLPLVLIVGISLYCSNCLRRMSAMMT